MKLRATTQSAQFSHGMRVPYGSNSNAALDGYSYPQGINFYPITSMSSLAPSTPPEPFLLPSPFPNISPEHRNVGSHRRRRHTNPTPGAMSLTRDMEPLPGYPFDSQSIPFEQLGSSPSGHVGGVKKLSDSIEQSRKRKQRMASYSTHTYGDDNASSDDQKLHGKTKMRKTELGNAAGSMVVSTPKCEGDITDVKPRTPPAKPSADVFKYFKARAERKFVSAGKIMVGIEHESITKSTKDDGKEKQAKKSSASKNGEALASKAIHASSSGAIGHPKLSTPTLKAPAANDRTLAPSSTKSKTARSSAKSASKTKKPQFASHEPRGSKTHPKNVIGQFELKEMTGITQTSQKQSAFRRHSARLNKQNQVQGPNAGQAAKKRHSMK